MARDKPGHDGASGYYDMTTLSPSGFLTVGAAHLEYRMIGPSPESALITHPAILEAAVVPEADPEGLLKPKAFVVLRADIKTDGLHEALKEHVKQKIGPWKYPRWIDVVDSLPKTATGKIQRFKLRDNANQ